MAAQDVKTKLPYAALAGCATLVLVALPPVLGNYFTILLTFSLLTALMGLAFTFLLRGGYLSLGLAGFYAIGAYTIAIFYKHVGEFFWPALFSGIVLSGIAAFVIGLLCAKLQRMYFGLLTFAFSQMIYVAIWRWTPVTGGDDGLAGISRLPINFYFVRLNLVPPLHYYYFTLIVFLIVAAALWFVLNSNFGYILKAMGSNLERAVFIGVGTRKHCVIAFTIHGMVCGLAGTLQAPFTSLANPELAHVISTVEVHISCLAGGLGAFSGPLVGSLLYVFVKSYLITWIENWMIAMGLLLIILVLLFRKGIMGFLGDKLGLPL
jgi:branched-chain amino acid transport system permease protein